MSKVPFLATVGIISLVGLIPAFAVLNCPLEYQAWKITTEHEEYIIRKDGEKIPLPHTHHAEPKAQHATTVKPHQAVISEGPKAQKATRIGHIDEQVRIDAKASHKELAQAPKLQVDETPAQLRLEAAKRVAEPKKELAKVEPLITAETPAQQRLEANMIIIAPPKAATAGESDAQKRLLEQAKRVADATKRMTENAAAKPE